MAKVTKELRLKRLRRWLKVLHTVADNAHLKRHFNMGTWGRRTMESSAPFHKRVLDRRRVKHACGTAACAAGFAAVDPVLKRQGLCLKFAPGSTEANLVLRPGFNTKNDIRGFDAITEFFGLTMAETVGLTMPTAYATPRAEFGEVRSPVALQKEVSPQHVITRLEKVIAKYAARLT